MRRILRKCVHLFMVVIAVLALMPGAEELAEQVAERFHHGHPAHSVPDERDPFCADHGETSCPGAACSCHVGSASTFDVREAGALFQENWMTLNLDVGTVPRLYETLGRIAGGADRLHARATAPPTPPPNHTV